MATIVQNPQAQESAPGMLAQIVQFLIEYWWALALFMVIVVALAVIYYLIIARNEDARKRDDATYATAQNLADSAKMNAKTEWIRTRYSWMNLLWLGIPFKKHEHSVQVRDIRDNLIGYYRGHTKTQGGDHLFRVYKTKSWLGLVEDTFLLYCPMSVTVQKVDDDGNPIKKKGVYQEEIHRLPDNIIEFDPRGNEIRIRCNTIQKLGNYYFFPNYVFVRDNTEKHIDLTNEISQEIAKQNWVLNIERAYTDMSRALGKAIEVNPLLRYGQKEPEREKRVEDIDEQ